MNVSESFVNQIASMKFHIQQFPSAQANTMTCPVCKGMVHYYDHTPTPPIKHTDDCAYMEARRLVQQKRRIPQNNLCMEIPIGDTYKCILGADTPVGMVLKIELHKGSARACAVLKMGNGDTRRVSIIGSVFGNHWVELSTQRVQQLAAAWKVPYIGIECEI